MSDREKRRKIPEFVVIPTICYKGTAHIQSPQLLSELQKILLKYIYDEPNLIKVIEDFNINKHIIQHSLVELFYQGLIYINFNLGMVTLSEEIQKIIEADALDEYKRIGTPELKKIKWIQEGISGGVLSYPKYVNFLKRPLHKINPVYLKPLHGGAFTPLRQLSHSTLVKAALDQFNRNFGETSHDLINNVERITNIRVFQTRKMYLRIKTSQLDDSRINYRTPIAYNIPPRILSCWTQSLNDYDIFDSFYTEEFDILDNSCAYRLNAIFKKCQSDIKKLLNDPAIKTPKQIYFLTNSFEKNIDFIISKSLYYISSINNVKLMPEKPSEFLPIFSKTIAETERLVIIGSAFLSSNWIFNYGKIIADLLKDDKRVILIYGFPPENLGISQIDKELDNVKAEFFDRFNVNSDVLKNLQIVYATPKFHSKLCLIDQSKAFLGSLNFLSSNFKEFPNESVVLIEGGEILEELLEYILEHLPNFGPARIWCERLSHVKHEINLSARRQTLFGSFKDEGHSTLQLINQWREEQSKYLRENIHLALHNIQTLINQITSLPSCLFIREMDHRDFMRKGLRDSKNQFAIATDRIHQRTFSAGFHLWINNALDRNVKVSIIWGREKSPNLSDPTFKQSIDTIKLLKSQIQPQIILSEYPSGSHAKLCLLDNSVSVVTSFNFLSIGGVPQMERMLSGELGLVINSQSINSKLNNNFFKNN